MKIAKQTICLIIFSAFLAACGATGTSGSANPNFPSLGNPGIEPSSSIDSGSSGKVIDIAPTIPSDIVVAATEYSGAIGSVADQLVEQVLCIIIDGNGGNVDLAVCDAESADAETNSADRVCPDEIGESHCVSVEGGAGPDFCEVSGARDYLFSIINRSATEVLVAYQVIDVTTLSTQSCDDLEINEATVTADTQ